MMAVKSKFPVIDIPQTDILTYLFPHGKHVSDEPLWIDSGDSSKSHSPRSALLLAKQLAIGLLRQDVGPGDVVMLHTPNHINVIVAFFATVGVGAAFTGCNPAHTVDEMSVHLCSTQPKVILSHPSIIKTALAARQKARLCKTPIFQFDADPTPLRPDAEDWKSMMGSEQEAERWSWEQLTPPVARTRVAAINFSSGTTGAPKGVCISHYNLIANVEQHIYVRFLHQTNRPPERWLGFLPLYHAYGQLYSFLMAPKLSVPVYIMRSFHYETFLSVIQHRRITHLQAIPPILTMLVKRPETKRYDLSSLVDILCGAAPLSTMVQNAVVQRFGLTIHQGWGMTELTCGGMNTPGGLHDTSGSVGMLHPNCECKLVNDGGCEVGPGQRGEIFIRGPNVCTGYWQNEQATRETIDLEGWLRTGDVAVMSEDGWFWIVDRKKELIKVQGFQVAPAEMEAVLLEHPAVADAAVVGIPLGNDEEERPRAYLALKDGCSSNINERLVQAWLKKRVARYKWLDGGVAFVQEVPRLVSGKINRKIVRTWAKRDAEVMLRGIEKARSNL